MITHNQLSMADIFSDCQEIFDLDKPHFLDLLENHIRLDDIIPASFREELPDSSTRARYDVRAVNDCLSVDFIASDSGLSFTDVHLVGPAVRVADIIVD